MNKDLPSQAGIIFAFRGEKIVALILILCCFTIGSFAFTTEKKDTIVGLILNEKGKGMKNVPVSAKGYEMVYTNRNGIFLIVGKELPDSITVMLPSRRILHIGIRGLNFLKILANEKSVSVSEAKDEIVNIGYDHIRKSRSSVSTSTITGDQLRESGESNLIYAIAGKVPGVNVVYKEDGAVELRIRGGSSLTGNNSPLYIVDGSIVDNIQSVNINDVEKIDILKDGSMYGTRGSNGVIVITTKH